MEIKEIKSKFSLSDVLTHYNLKPDKNHRLVCPFHPNKTPSLQIYPATNTYCCFSSNCKAGTGHQIQFIELKESCNKHKALLKATALLNGNAITTAQPAAAKLFIVEQSEIPTNDGKAARLEKIAVVTKLFKYFTKGIATNKESS